MKHGCLFLGASFSREDTFSAAAAALHTNYCHLQSICWNCCAYLRFKAITSLLLNATKWPLILKLCGWLTVFQFLQCRYWGFCSSSFFKNLSVAKFYRLGMILWLFVPVNVPDYSRVLWEVTEHTCTAEGSISIWKNYAVTQFVYIFYGFHVFWFQVY